MAAAFSGKLRQRAAGGAESAPLPCQVTVGAENLVVAAPRGGSLAFDLGDIDALDRGEYELTLHLCSGQQVLLGQFGRTFETLAHDLVEAWRDRLVRCLLLEDLPEVARFDLTARLDGPRGSFASPAHVRLYESNVAVLPLQAAAVQWRLADLDAVDVDRDAYTVTLVRGPERLVFSKIGRRTEELAQRIDEGLAALDARGLEVLRTVFPFLDAAGLAQAGRLMKDGRSAPVARLCAIDRRVEAALSVNMADARLRPYFESLVNRSGPAGVYAGFTSIWPGEEEPAAGTDPATAPGENGAAAAAEGGETAAEEQPSEAAEPEPADGESQVLYWFFFLLRPTRGGTPDTLAWEATSRSGRATYFFSLAEAAGGTATAGAADAAVATIDRALGALNFRRAPIYLPDQALDIQPRYHRYAIAARRIPELQALRRAFRGRAIHTTPSAWNEQVERALAGG
jgi:hypothetical protein